MGAATQCVSEIMRQAPDIGSGRTDDLEVHQWRLETRDFESRDLDPDSWRGQRPTAPGELVRRHSTDLFSGKRRRDLVDISGKLQHHLLNLIERTPKLSWFTRWIALPVVGRC